MHVCVHSYSAALDSTSTTECSSSSHTDSTDPPDLTSEGSPDSHPAFDTAVAADCHPVWAGGRHPVESSSNDYSNRPSSSYGSSASVAPAQPDSPLFTDSNHADGIVDLGSASLLPCGSPSFIEENVEAEIDRFCDASGWELPPSMEAYAAHQFVDWSGQQQLAEALSGC